MATAAVPTAAAAPASVVFVLGGPGSGKGTQCARLCDAAAATVAVEAPTVAVPPTVAARPLVHLSAGELLRAERAAGTSERAALIERCIENGQIVPVAITMQLLKDAMLQHMQRVGDGNVRFLIDGFPRNKDNLDGWNEAMAGVARLNFVLYLECSEAVMEQRLLHRGKTSGRNDDNLESIRKRFRTYLDSTMPIIEHFESLGKLRRVDSSRPVDDVFADVLALFQE